LSDRNYTDPGESGTGAVAERAGDITGEPPTNRAVDRDKASKMANLLEGLEFPATKEMIRSHLNLKSPAMGNRINDVIEAVENKLGDDKEYGSAYDVEVAADLVKRAGAQKPYVRNRALNRANRKRTGESIREDPYAGRESIRPASSREVSPNTPSGEEV